MKQTFLFLAALLFIVTSSYGQEKVIQCISDEIIADEIKSNPAMAQRIADHEDKLYHDVHGSVNKKAGEGCEVRIIPCVFHIIHYNDGGRDRGNISDQRVQEYIDQTNAVFRSTYADIDDIDEMWHDRMADMMVELRLAKIDPNGNPTTGIVRVEDEATMDAYDDVKNISRWDPYKYLNIWIVYDIDYPNAGNGRVLGYARFPSWESGTRRLSGIVMVSDAYEYGETLPHELGHYLDLYHPFQSGCGSENCLTSGDRVCDTPPTNSDAEQNCPKGRNECNNDFPDEPDMQENIMNYTSCRSILTKGQKERVDYTLNGHRAQLISVNNLLATGVIKSKEELGAPVAEYASSRVAICEGEVIEFTDLSCTDSENTEYKWTFPSGQPSAAFVPNPTVTYSKPGVFDVSLVISNSSGTDTVIRNGSIRVSPQVSDIKAPFSEGFEEANFPYPNWSFYAESGSTWERNTEVSKDGDASFYVDNYDQARGGDEFIFRTPSIDMTTAKSNEFNFDIAYAIRGSSSKELLQISVIDECDGASYLRYTKTGNGFKSVSDARDGLFIPKADEWMNVNFDMTLFKSMTSVSVEFKFTAFGEQNIYIDNIMMGSWPLNVTEVRNDELKVYPNPANDILTIDGLDQVEVQSIVLRDLSGRIVRSTTGNLGSSSISYDLKNLQQGMYLLEINTAAGKEVRRIIRE